jgi:hypothetical protein
MLLRAADHDVAGLMRGFGLLFLVSGASLGLALFFLSRMEEKPLRDTHAEAA